MLLAPEAIPAFLERASTMDLVRSIEERLDELADDPKVDEIRVLLDALLDQAVGLRCCCGKYGEMKMKETET